MHESQTTATVATPCEHCGNAHGGRCPEIKAIEYYANGKVKRVEYHDIRPNPYQYYPMLPMEPTCLDVPPPEQPYPWITYGPTCTDTVLMIDGIRQEQDTQTKA